MPTLKRLAELQKNLRKLGGEQETVGKWGEQPYVRELPPPSAIDEGKPSALDANRFIVSTQSTETPGTENPIEEQEPSLESLLDAPSPDEDYTSFLKSMNLDTLSAPVDTTEGIDDDLAKLLEPEASFATEELISDTTPGTEEMMSDIGSIPGSTPGTETTGTETTPEIMTSEAIPDITTSEAAPDSTPGTAAGESLSEMIPGELTPDLTPGTDIEPLEPGFFETTPSEPTPGTELGIDFETVSSAKNAGIEETKPGTNLDTELEGFNFQSEMSTLSDFPEENGITSESQKPVDRADREAAPDTSSIAEFGTDFSDFTSGDLEDLTPGTAATNIEETTPETTPGTEQGIETVEPPSGLSDFADLPSMEDIHDLESLSFGNETSSTETTIGEQSSSSESIEVPEIGTEAFHAPDELDQELASLEKGTLEPENFSIDSSWDESFTIPGFEPKKQEKPGTSAFVAPLEIQKPVDDSPVAIELTEDQVDELQETLLSYPLNVRLCVEDIIANNHGTMTHQKELIQMLVDGASAYDAAKLASKILRRPIEVPRGYDKRRGAAFEEEKNSFRYIFIHSILPVLQILVLAAIGLGILGFIGYNFIYRPIHAQILYTRGYNQIIKDKYPESLQFFIDATNEWRMKPWFYKYAEKYIEKRQYVLAEKIYWTLLSDDYWPKDIKGTLDYARMKSELQYDFAHAEKEVMERIVKWNYFHKNALLFLVRNYLNWAYYLEQQYKPPASEEIANIYNKARLQLATLMEKYGKTDQYLELMLLYLIRSEKVTGKDNVKEIAPYAKYYLGNKKSKFSAATLAELA
ncbi:MAG TPA: hypothetical protein PK746_08910, partial [Spirochaetales bacterium]|nr:hypothetical protein [Spirochaetales bacterium]